MDILERHPSRERLEFALTISLILLGMLAVGGIVIRQIVNGIEV